MAAANPSDTEAVTLEFELNRADGTTVTTRQRTLAPLGHLGIFLFELFEGVEGIAEFVGSVRIRSVAGAQLAATEAIEQPPGAKTDSAADAQTFAAGASVVPSTRRSGVAASWKPLGPAPGSESGAQLGVARAPCRRR